MTLLDDAVYAAHEAGVALYEKRGDSSATMWVFDDAGLARFFAIAKSSAMTIQADPQSNPPSPGSRSAGS